MILWWYYLVAKLYYYIIYYYYCYYFDYHYYDQLIYLSFYHDILTSLAKIININLNHSPGQGISVHPTNSLLGPWHWLPP